MKNLKLFLCLAFAIAFAVFELSNSESVTGQSGSSALSAPTGVMASDLSYNNKVTVQWDTIRGATSYRIFRNAANDPATATDVGVTTNNSFLDNTATAGQTFFYWVRAENSSTVSDMSTTDQGTRANTLQQGPVPPLNPPPPAPAGNELTAAKIYLGKALFWDEQLSSTRTVSCGTCHHSGNGGTDPRSVPATTTSTNPGLDSFFGTPDDVRGSSGVPSTQPDGSYVNIQSYGLNDQVTGRKSVSYLNAAYPPLLFWDGRATDTFRDPITNAIILNNGAALENQVLGPPVSSAEMAHGGRDWNDVASRINGTSPLILSPSVPTALATWINGRTYPELFLETFGTSEVTPARIAMAIASFERSLYTDRTPFDLDVAGITQLTQQQQRGRGVFNASSCNVCHAGTLFTDNTFRNIGVRPAGEDTGRFQVTGNQQDVGEFRVPSLRNVSLRGSFFHNGQFTTLQQVVAFYNRGGDFRNEPNVPQNLIRPLGLGPGQQADLVAFLQALTDPRVAAESAPFDRPMLYIESDRVPQISGTGVAGSGGFMPQIKLISPPYIGNPNFIVSVSSALGGSNATLVISTVDPGMTLYPKNRRDMFRKFVTTANTGNGNGWASLSFPLAGYPRTRATVFYARWYVADPSVLGGYAVSQLCRIPLFNAVSPGSAAPAEVDEKPGILEIKSR